MDNDNHMSVKVSSTILIGPQNRTSFSQSTVNFSCTSDGPATANNWRYAAYFSSPTVSIYDHRGRNEKLFDDRFMKTIMGATSTLTIRNVERSDAGIYICREGTSPIHWPAQLSVIGK